MHITIPGFGFGLINAKIELLVKIKIMGKETRKQVAQPEPKPVLPAAALWWRNLTAKQKAYMWDKYYDDHEITNERINERYEYDKRMSAEHAIDPNRF